MRFCDFRTSSCVPPFCFWRIQECIIHRNLISKLLKEPLDGTQTKTSTAQGSDLLSGHGGDVGHDDLVDEGAESEPEVGGDVLHGGGEEVSERRELLLVVLHRLGEVHQVVEVHGVVLGLLVEKVQVVSLVWKGENLVTKESQNLFKE